MFSLETPSCLIGYSGFVGSALRRQTTFDLGFNSRSFRDMAGQSFGQVVCCGVSAVKWQANLEPEADRAAIQALGQVLRTVEAESFVLISTVDVHPVPRRVDEDADCRTQPNHAYGRHRLEFEEIVRARFPHALILRLPGLFGPGLRKNVLFDLLNQNRLEAVDADSRFQWYDITRLNADIALAQSAGLQMAQLAVEPVRTGDIAAMVFPELTVRPGTTPPVSYDVRTRNAALFGGGDGYIMNRAEVVRRIGCWAALERVVPGGSSP